MKSIIEFLKQKIPVFVILFLMNGICLAQDFGESKRAITNVSNSEYPRILPDLRVIFSIKAPEAQKVQIQIDKKYDLLRDQNGVWTGTTDPQVPVFITTH